MNMRTILAWVVAIAAFGGVQETASILSAVIGVPTFLNVDTYIVHYGLGAEDERSSITTSYGWGVNVLSILAGIAAWHFAQRKQMTPEGRALFLGCLLGSGILIIGGIPLFKAFAHSSGPTAVLGNLLELGLAATAFFAGKKIMDDNKKREREAAEELRKSNQSS